MKLGTLLTIALLTFCYNAWGQDSLNYHGQPFAIRDPAEIKRTNLPLIFIKEKNKILQIPPGSNFIDRRRVRRLFKNFNLDWIKSIEVVKDQHVLAKYGRRGQYGVLIINLNEGIFDKLPHKIKKYENAE